MSETKLDPKMQAAVNKVLEAVPDKRGFPKKQTLFKVSVAVAYARLSAYASETDAERTAWLTQLDVLQDVQTAINEILKPKEEKTDEKND